MCFNHPAAPYWAASSPASPSPAKPRSTAYLSETPIAEVIQLFRQMLQLLGALLLFLHILLTVILGRFLLNLFQLTTALFHSLKVEKCKRFKTNDHGGKNCII